MKIVNKILFSITLICVLSLSLISSRKNSHKNKKNLSKRARRANPPNVYTGHTAWASHSNGKVTSLKDHKVLCSTGTALVRFQLQRDDRNIRYSFDCTQLSIFKDQQIVIKNTKWNSYNGDGGATNYLDRHEMKCGDWQAITGFQLQVQGDKMRYEYYCTNENQELMVKGSEMCYDKSTSWTQGGKDYDVVYLDRQNVEESNPEKGAIKSIKLETKYQSWSIFHSYNVEYRYKIKQCGFRIATPKVVNASSGDSATANAHMAKVDESGDEFEVTERKDTSRRRRKY